MSNGFFNFNFLALLLSETLGGSQIYTSGPYAPWTPPSGEIFLPKASTLQYLIVFLISTFQLQQFPRFQGVPHLRQGALCPLYAPQGKIFCTRGEYFTMSNGVFNFNFLALLLSEILGGSQIYTRGPYTFWTPPSGEIFVPKASISQCLIVFLISTFQLQYLLGWSQIYIRGPCAPRRPPSKKILTCAQVLAYIYITVNFQLRSSIHAVLTERSLYNRLALKNLPKWGFWGEGSRYLVGTPLGMQ